MAIHLPHNSAPDLPANLPGLDTAIRLKADLIHKMAASSMRHWRQHLADFVSGLAESGVRETTALLVLLAEVRQELRAFGIVANRASWVPARQRACRGIVRVKYALRDGAVKGPAKYFVHETWGILLMFYRVESVKTDRRYVRLSAPGSVLTSRRGVRMVAKNRQTLRRYRDLRPSPVLSSFRSRLV